MKNIQKKYIQKLIDIMKDNELTELTLEDSETSIVIKSSGYTPVIKDKTKIETEVSADVEQNEDEVEEEKELVPIRSNMIGIFYSKPSPKDKPFVKVGDEIEEGDVVCIIETIKLVNKITSDVSGRIAEICIEDGKPVEYGQVIMYVEQN